MKKLATIVLLVCLVASVSLFAAGQKEAAVKQEGLELPI